MRNVMVRSENRRMNDEMIAGVDMITRGVMRGA